jgi:hypothetical protein
VRTLPPYVPPGPDEPLDPVQQALVRMFVRIIVREIREGQAREAADASPTPAALVKACHTP